MLESAKDVVIEGSKLVDITRDYVHNEHHYHFQIPEFDSDTFSCKCNESSGICNNEHEIFFNFWNSSRTMSEIYGPSGFVDLVDRTSSKNQCMPFSPKVSKGPLTRLQRRKLELQEKRLQKDLQSLGAAERKQTGHRRPFMRPPTRESHSSEEMKHAAFGISPPSNVIYSTDPANAKRSNHGPDAGAVGFLIRCFTDEEKSEHSPEPNNIPFPLISYTSPDFDVYEELYQNAPDADNDWGSHPDPDPYSDESNFEEPPTSLPPLPPLEVDDEYWQAFNAWYAWYMYCVSSWQASMAAWTAALMSWTPPWLGMCAPSWLGAWSPWR